MNTRRLQVLFLLAMTALCALVVVAGYELLGRNVAIGVAAGLTYLVLHASVRVRRAEAARRRAAGRTCTCCTTSHFDPVEVV